MRHRKVLLTTAVVAALALAGCGSSKTDTTSTPKSTAVNPTARLDGVTLTLWTAATTAHSADQVITAFESATGAKVNTVVVPDPYETNLPTKLATGAKPDLMFWQPTTSALTKIRATDQLQQLDGQPWESALSPAVSPLGKLDDGHRYAAIVSAPSTIGVYYNKQAFAKAGITSDPQNFAALLDDAHKLEAAGIVPFYEAGGDKWPLQWLPVVLMADMTKAGTFWPALNKNQASWTDPQIVSTITAYQDIINQGLTNSDYKTGTFAEQGDSLYNGKVGMVVQLGALEAEIAAKHSAAEVDANVGFFPISQNDNVATYVPDQSNAVVAPKTGNAKQEAAARQFLAFWLGPDYTDYVTAAKGVSIETAVPSPDGVPQLAVTSFKALDGAVGAYQVEAIVAPDLHLHLADMLYGKKTPQQVAQACEDQFKQVAAAQGAPGF